MVENVDPDQVVISIDDKLRPLRPISKDCCIYRVPQTLRKVNEDAYRPWVVSIGPFHHSDPKLEPMQEHKLRYWQSFLKRNEENDRSCYVQLVREKQEDIRDCYNQQIKLDGDTFVEMVLLDAAFIIELFIRTTFEQVSVTDHICHKSFFMSLVLRDLKLEENQLPFFIINDLYSLAFPHLAAGNFPFTRLACVMFFSEEDSVSGMIAKANFKHFVDLSRQFCLWSILEKESDLHDDDSNKKETSGVTFCPSVTELHEAGVRFKVATSNNLFDISFKDGVLAIPRLMLDDNTETSFRNMMAFEQLHDHPNYYISDYFSLLDSLINTAKDVEILVEKDIIDNWLGSYKEAAKLINNICIHILTSPNNFYYSGICQKLNKYKTRRWPKHKAALKRKYFNHPWAPISLFYAIVLFILAVLQVITGFTK